VCVCVRVYAYLCERECVSVCVRVNEFVSLSLSLSSFPRKMANVKKMFVREPIR